MLLDKFVMSWSADTKQATQELTTLESSAKGVSDGIEKSMGEAFGSIGDQAKGAAQEVELAAKKMKASAGDVQGTSQKVKQNQAKEEQNAKALDGAHKKGLSSAERWERIVKGFKERFGGGGDGGKGGGIIGGAMGEAKTFGSGVVGALPGVSGLVAVGGAATLAAAAVAMFAKTISIANDRAERGLSVRKDAWEAGRSQTQYNAQVLKGKRLGLNEAEVKASMTGLADRLRDALTNPYGEASLRFRQARINPGTVGTPRDIEDTTNAIVNHLRALVKTKGQSEGIAWATQRMGMTFEMASRYAGATDEEISKLNEGLRKEAILLTVGQVKSEKYALAKRDVDNAMEAAGNRLSGKVTPALTRFSKQLEESTKQSNGFINVLGEVSAGIVDLGAKLLSFLDDVSSKVADIANTRKKAGNDFDSLEEYMRAKGIQPEGPNGNFLTSQFEQARKDRDAAQAAAGGGAVPGETEEYRKARDMSSLKESFKAKLETAPISDQQKDAANKLGIETLGHMARQGDSLDQMNDTLDRIIAESMEQGKALDAQVKNGTPPIPVLPVTIGLEQALSLWASGIGKAAGMRGPEGAAAAGSRLEYEQAAKIKMAAQRDITWNPGLLVSQEAARGALSGAKNAANVANSAAPGMVFNQENNYNVTVSQSDRNLGTVLTSALKTSQDQATRATTNAVGTSMVK